MKKNPLALACIIVFLCQILNAQGIVSPKEVITITFEAPPDGISIKTAPLKYNKQFAYSFTLDDGYKSAYTHGLPLFNGSNGESCLKYTDGAGNDIFFKAGLAIHSVNKNNQDLHLGNADFLSWAEIIELNNLGWDVLNHSFSHAANDITIDYDAQIQLNQSRFNEKLGLKVQHFVIPSGDKKYIEPAVRLGMKSIFNQSSDFEGAKGFLHVDSLNNISHLKIFRRSLENKRHNKTNIAQRLDTLIPKLDASQHIWLNDFTHRIDSNDFDGGLDYSVFKFYMKHLHEKYGKSGLDNVWMASAPEVYEYLELRNAVKLSYTINGAIAEVTLDLENIPKDLKRYTLTLAINTPARISTISSNLPIDFNYQNTKDVKIINIHLNQPPTGILSEENGDFKIRIYPNPSKNNISVLEIIGFKKNEIMKASISDIQGRLIWSNSLVMDQYGNYHKENFLKDLNLKLGQYLLHLETSNGIVSRKWLIE